MSVMLSRESVLARVLVELRLEFGDSLVGMLLAGSAAVSDRYDDFDICVVTNTNWSQRRRSIIAEANVDLFVENEKAVVASFMTGRRPHLIQMFAAGRVVADPSGTVAHLKERASQLLAQTAPPNDDEIFRLVFEPRDTLRRYAAAHGDDQSLAGLLLFELVPAVLRAALLLRGGRGVPTKKLLAAVRDAAPGVADLGEKIIVRTAGLPSPQEVEAFVRTALGDRFDLTTHSGRPQRTS